MQPDITNILAQWTIWTFIKSNWAMLSMICTIIALITIPSIVLGRYIRIMLNILNDTPLPLSMGPLDFDRIKGGQEVRFRAFDGTSLRGMLLPGNPAAPRRGLILFCHEFASDMYSCARYCRLLLEDGFDVFTFDFRGHGESSSERNYRPRQWASDREIDDVLGACAFAEDYLDSQGLPVELGILGVSRGACAAILACTNNPAVKAFVTDGLFSTDITIECFMKRWAKIFAKIRFVYENHPPAFWKFLRWLLFRFTGRSFNCRFPSVYKTLGRMKDRPLLMIHGQRDSYIPLEQVQELFAAAPEPKSLWIVPGAKHNQPVIVQADQYASRTVKFFRQYLTPGTRRPILRDRTVSSGGQAVMN